jgi:DNA-binding response OmpR family regulator
MGKRILLVEDDRSLIILYTRAFTRLGFEVSVAGDAETALERLRQDSPDLIILDIRLKGDVNGLELLGHILSLQRIPTIINTAYTCFRDSFLSWSADAYVLKSSDLTELTDTVNRLTALTSQKAVAAAGS